MKNFTLFILCVVTVFLQLSVEGVFFSARRIPDLALALVITLVLALGLKESLKWILLTGILIDAGSSTVFGTTTLAYFLIGWMLSGLIDVADIRSKKTFFLAFFAAAAVFSEIAKDIFIFVSLKIRANFFHEMYGVPLNIFSVDYMFKIIYTIFAAYLIYYIFRKVSRAFFFEPIKLGKKYV
jgi:rod shape-determining protein MreD